VVWLVGSVVSLNSNSNPKQGCYSLVVAVHVLFVRPACQLLLACSQCVCLLWLLALFFFVLLLSDRLCGLLHEQAVRHSLK
jgi:hypothetical protein